MCVPTSKKGLPYEYKTYEDVDEPVFDPSLHLDLEVLHHIKSSNQFLEIKRIKVLH